MRGINNITRGVNRLGINAGKPAGLPAALRAKFLYLWTGKYNGDNLQSDLPNNASIQYGNLYNHYALADERNICAEGWHIPTIADFNTLVAAVGGAIGNAPKLKATGTVYWKTGNNGTNESGLNLRGSGQRSSGRYYSLRDSCMLWTDDLVYYGELLGTKRAMVEVMHGDDDIWVSSFVPAFTAGLTVRLVKDVTSLSDGEEGFYIGNDLRFYKTICIGTQEWLAESLTETKYRNGNNIPLVLDSSWSTLDSGAYCYYNGMITNSYIGADPDVLIVTEKDWSTKHIPPETLATIALPNDSRYIQADNLYDHFWIAPYVETPIFNQITHAELIASETTRTFVKYSDFTPYDISAIGVLKAGAILTTADKIKLNKFFKLWAEYWGEMMDSGYIKDNRIGNE